MTFLITQVDFKILMIAYKDLTRHKNFQWKYETKHLEI